MKLQNLRRILTTDYKQEYQDLVGKLAETININLETLYSVINRRTDLRSNIDCTIRDVDISVNSSGIPKNRTTYGIDDKNRQIYAVQVGKVDNLTNTSTYPTSGIHITWEQVNEGIQINHVTGLVPDNQYRIRVISYY